MRVMLFALIFMSYVLAHNQGKSIKLSKRQAHHKHHKHQKFLDHRFDVNEDSVELMLQKHENFYLAELTVGTPGQKLTVLIDTGSPNLLLTSSLCQQDSCQQHGTYNPSNSNSSYYIEAIKLANGDVGNEIDIQFASGNVVGVFFEDRVCLSQYCVENQFIIGIIEESEDIFSQMKFDGILGLGRIKEAVVRNASFIHNLEYDDTRNFSLYLSSSEDDDAQSELVLGGVSHHLIADGEEFRFFDVTSENLWTINIVAVYLGDERIDNCNKCQGLIDSGTSFISFPVYAMERFYERFGVYQACNNVDSFPDLTFVFDHGMKFKLSGNQYFKRNTHALFSKEICIPFVKNNPIIGDELFVLGQPFLVHHYVWFDEDESKIGITVILGDSNVGKSCILTRLVKNVFTEFSQATVGSQFYSKDISLGDSIIKFQIWDTAGQEKYRSLSRIYYQQCQVVIFVFDIANKESFHGLYKWYDDLKENCKVKKLVIGIAANKVDLQNEVDIEEIKKFTDKIQAEYFLISAKTGQGVEGTYQNQYEDMFERLAYILHQRNIEIDYKKSKSMSIQLDVKVHKKKKKCC